MKVENTKICIRKRWHDGIKRRTDGKKKQKEKAYEKNRRKRK